MAGLFFWVWPLLLGGIVGWLLANWLCRRSSSLVITAKDAEIARLQNELQDKRARPMLLEPPSGPAVESHVADPLARIRELESEVAAIPGLRAQIEALQRPQRNDNGATEKKDASADREAIDWRARCAEFEAHIREQARSLAARDQEIRMLRQEPTIDIQAAKLAGFTAIKGADDLEILQGIEPKIAELLRNHGIYTFAELARATPAQIQSIVGRAESCGQYASPETWLAQAELASRNLWLPLKLLQSSLAVGRREQAA